LLCESSNYKPVKRVIRQRQSANGDEIHQNQMAQIIDVIEQIQNGEIDLASARPALKTL